MGKVIRLIILAFLLVAQQLIAQNVHQDISATINVSDSKISVKNRIVLPGNLVDNSSTTNFYLNSALTIKKISGGKLIEIDNTDDKTKNYVKQYQVVLKKSSDNTIVLEYSGVINDAIEQSAAEYARGFSETKGTITDNGIYLAGSTFWLPKFGKNILSTFTLEVMIDKEWSIVSQGKRTKNSVDGEFKNIIYDSPEPMDEVYLVGAKWTEYSKMLGNVEVQAFLRTPDQELADRYLNVTSGFLEMYNTLIGDYPYTKFALVENFWETGYGMPSFTLLGEKVIRFPWILYSSYPHELLHNYWGNGVFVDYSSGNWCEGITAYMADHLFQEQRGSGATYRRNTLQKFTDYVNDDNDMPINQFLSRNNSAEEAIGYGKVLMVNNMLREELGDDIFIKAYQKFYRDNEFTKASFADIRKSFEEVSGRDLTAFFEQWIDRKGAPAITVTDVNSAFDKNKYQVSFTLTQAQKEDVFTITIPVAFYLENSENIVWEKVLMDSREKQYIMTFDQKPLKMAVDPEFNVMRRLDRAEVPASLSQVFGSKQSVIILPSASAHIDAYKELAIIWKETQAAQGKEASVVMDSDLKSIPTDKSVWIIGFENSVNMNALQTLYSTSFNSETNTQITDLAANGALVYAIPNPENAAQSIGFVGANSPLAIKALTGKLLHYGKYGYLGFEGDEAKNVLKGSLPALSSPLVITLGEGEIKAKIVPRKALYQPQRSQH